MVRGFVSSSDLGDNNYFLFIDTLYWSLSPMRLFLQKSNLITFTNVGGIHGKDLDTIGGVRVFKLCFCK